MKISSNDFLDTLYTCDYILIYYVFIYSVNTYYVLTKLLVNTSIKTASLIDFRQSNNIIIRLKLHNYFLKCTMHVELYFTIITQFANKLFIGELRV